MSDGHGTYINKEGNEVRVYWTGNLVVNDMDLKMLRFKLESEQYFRNQNEEHEMRMAALKLKTLRFPPWPMLFIPLLPILYFLFLLVVLRFK